jgi:hypothetical protein
LRQYFTDDSRHVSPHAASLAFDSGTFPGCADVLAWESARYHVNKSAPWLPVEGLNVIPDRERFEASIVLPGDQNVPCVGVPLDGADGSPPEELAPEYASTSACEKCQLIHSVGLGTFDREQIEGGKASPPTSLMFA